MTASPRARLAIAGSAIALTGLLAACGSSGGSGGTTKDSTTTTTTTVVDTSETTSTPATSTTIADGTTSTTLSDEGRDTETTNLDTLPDGDHYGYIAGVEEGKVEGQDVQVIIFDKVDFLSGQEAIDAAKEDGVELDTDYYVRNQNQTVRRIAVVPDASVTSLEGGSPDPVPSSVSEVANQEFLFKINVGNVRGITTISSIDAVYLP